MAKVNLTIVAEGVRRRAELERAEALPDATLLDRFVTCRDGAAFEALVRRHGAMVQGVCRRLLRRAEDAEDASQATFLVLAHRAAAVRNRQSLASWLHGVACRVALKSRAGFLRKRGRELPLVEAPGADASGEVSWREALAVLDEELNRLPDAYRAPLVLCYLQGKTQDEAARELGLSLGALRGRLERARQRLHDRVSRRGVSLPALLLAAGLSTAGAQAAENPAFVSATVQAASLIAAGQAAAPSCAAALAKGALTTMRNTKLWMTGLTLAACLALAAGAVVMHRALRGGPEAAAREAAPTPRPGKPVWQPRVSIGDHVGSSAYVEFSPDAGALVTFDPSRSELRFWDTATWKVLAVHPLKKLFTGGGSYQIRTFAADGKTAVAVGQTAGQGGRPAPAVALFDVPGGKLRAVLPGAEPEFSADSKLLAVGRDGAIAIYEVATAKERLTIGVRGDWSRWFNRYGRRLSPDGRLLATARNGVVTLWDTATGKEVATLTGYFPVRSGEKTPFSPDGKTLVTAGKDRTVRLWDVPTGRERAALRGHELPYIDVAYSPDGKTLATVGHEDGIAAGVRQSEPSVGSQRRRPVEVKLWDVATGEARPALPGTTFWDDYACFSPDGSTLAYRRAVPGEMAHCMALWDLGANKERAVIPADNGVFSPDGKILETGKGTALRFWDTATGKSVSTVQVIPEGWVCFRSSSPDRRLMVTSACYLGKPGDPTSRSPIAAAAEITVWEYSDRPVKKETRGGARPAPPDRVGVAEQDPGEAGQAAGPGDAWESLKREFQASEAAFAGENLASKPERQKERITSLEGFTARALNLARKSPPPPEAAEALEFALRATAGGETARLADLGAQAVALARRDYQKSPSLDQLLPSLANHSVDAAEALLADAAEASPHRAVRGRAAYWLARRLATSAEAARTVRGLPGVAADLGLGEGTAGLLKRLEAIDPDRTSRRAEGLFESLQKGYADVKQVEGRPAALGEEAERGLFALRNLAIGKTAPQIYGEDLDGKTMKLSDYRGKVVVLVFCGYWCGPCRAMIPHEKALVERLAGEPFALLWVNSDEDRLLTREKMQKDGATWRSWWDKGRKDGPIQRRWIVDSWQSIYVLDAGGVIRFKQLRDKALDRAVGALLKEAGTKAK